MNKYYILFFLFQILLSNIQTEKIIKSIENGTFNIKQQNINNIDESMYIKGMIEINGEKSKTYFLDFYNKYPDNKYADDSIVKIAEYYYSKGYYVKSSEWYKKIPKDYPNSDYLEKSISYYLNSLIIIGESDSARYYTKKFKKKYPKIRFNNAFIKDYKEEKKINIIQKEEIELYDDNVKYSVQVGTYENYQTALSKKRMLSNEGFLGRIDEINSNGRELYSVRVGYYKKRISAEKELNRLKSRIGIYDSIIIDVR
jgi:hypothetical protein